MIGREEIIRVFHDVVAKVDEGWDDDYRAHFGGGYIASLGIDTDDLMQSLIRSSIDALEDVARANSGRRAAREIATTALTWFLVGHEIARQQAQGSL